MVDVTAPPKPELIQQAAAYYALYGTYAEAARKMAIPESTLRGWVKYPEYQASLAEVRAQRGEQLKAKLAKIIEDGYEQLHDRILNGDQKLVKDGEGSTLMHQPMSGKDLAIATGIVVDKLALISGNTPQQVQADKLAELADKLERVAKLSAQNIVDNSVDVNK